MERKHFFLYIVIFILLSFNLMLIFRLISGSGFSVGDTGTENTADLILSNTVAHQSVLCMESALIRLDGSLILEDETGKKILLKDIIGDNLKIAMRYSDLDCRLCVDNQINLIKEISQFTGDTNIILFAKYSKNRELYLFKRTNNLKIKIYNIKNTDLGIPLENANTPFIFLIDKNLTVLMAFVPPKEMPGINNLFKSVIVQKFNNLKNTVLL